MRSLRIFRRPTAALNLGEGFLFPKSICDLYKAKQSKQFKLWPESDLPKLKKTFEVVS